MWQRSPFLNTNVPSLAGKYVFGDIVDGRLFCTNEGEMLRGRKPAPIYELTLIDKTGKPQSMQDLAGDKRVDLHIGSDRLGELYLLSKANGKIWKVTGAHDGTTRRLRF